MNGTIKFGTGGWRAIIGDEFTKTNITILTQAIAEYVLENRDESKELALVVGFDKRFLSKAAATWVSEVLVGNGIKAYLINEEAPTPMTMFKIGDMNLEYGIQVTASHNAYEWNGIKFFIDGGRDAVVEVTDELQERVSKLNEADVKAVNFRTCSEGDLVEIINPVNEYIDRIMSLIDVDAIKRKGLKVLLDPMYGVSRIALQALLINCRVRVDTIHDTHDMMFGGKVPSPTSANLQLLKDLVVKGEYDLGVATDGDADRIGIITEKGQYVHANEILALLYYYYLEYRDIKSPVVRNISTTHLLDRIAKHYGQECVEVNVGFKHIAQGMEDSGAILGGESSGGIATKGHIRGKDGIYAAALLIEMISKSNTSITKLLEEIYEKFGKLYMVERNFRITEELRQTIKDKLFEKHEIPEYEFKVIKTSNKDGYKIYFENDCWILVRFSGTEPVIRIYAEMESEVEAVAVCNKMQKFLGISDLDRTE